MKKSKVKIGGAVFTALLFCVSYVGISFYTIPEKASAATWFPENSPIPDSYTIDDIKYLQEMNKTVCDNSAIGDNNTVLDIRDDNDYTIGKLADGKCWMTQNLRITHESIQAKDPNNTTGKITPTDTNTSSSYNIPASTDGMFSNVQSGGYYTNQEVHAADNKIYGAYYSYNVATVMSVAKVESGIALQDICPKGWRLPIGGTGTTNEFAKAMGYFGNVDPSKNYWDSSTSFSPLFANGILTINNSAWVAAGAIENTEEGPLFGAGGRGNYWSSTLGGTSLADRLFFGSGNITFSNSYYRWAGSSVRCVANEKVLESEDLSKPSFSDIASGSIAVKVANTISIDAVSSTEDITVDSTSISTGNFSASIAANTNYKVLLSAEKTSLTSANSTNEAEIPTSPNVRAGTNAWGILNSDNATYSAITNQEEEYYNTTANSTNPDVPGLVHTFNVGVSVSPSLPADTYSTDVTITAVAG